MPSPPGAIPVEAILKIALDKTGSQGIEDFLRQHEQGWGRLEQTINRVSTGLEGVLRRGLALAGVAGVGGVVANFMGTSEAGANVAVANGRATGGAGVWHPYAQGLLRAQQATGVDRLDIAQGLIMAVQSVGGNLGPQQAATLGGLIAGFGQVSGMSPEQVARVVAPMLQATHQPLSFAATATTLAGVQAALSNFPGSQAAGILPLIASLSTQQGLGGVAVNPAANAALLNAAAGANPLFRTPGILGSAAGGISGGLQNAYGNPSMEAFLQMAGIGYQQQRGGMTAGNVRAIMSEAARLYPDPTVRDMVLRSMFGGIPGADLLEAFTPGSKAYSALGHLPSTASQAQVRHLLNELDHAVKRSTPQGMLNRAGGGVLGWLEESPIHAVLGALGIWGGSKALGGGSRLLGRGLSRGLGRVLGGGAAESGADSASGRVLRYLKAGGYDVGAAGGDAGMLEMLSRFLPDAAGFGVGALAQVLLSDGGISTTSPRQIEGVGVEHVLAAALHKFGPGAMKSPRARAWMQAQLYSGNGAYGPGVGELPFSWAGGRGAYKHLQGGAGQLLDNVLGNQWATDPFERLRKSLDHLASILDRAGGAHLSSYSIGPGSGMPVSLMGAPAASALGASAPGMEFVALGLNGGSGGGGGGNPLFVSANIAPGGGAHAGAGAGGQACTLTWYDPALGGINSGNGAANPHSPTASGQPYQAGALTCAAPPAYPFGTQITFTYRGQSVTCTVNDRGGAITGSHFDLSRGAFQRLAPLSAGLIHASFQVVGGGAHHRSARAGAGASAGASGGARMVVDSRSAAGLAIAAAAHHAAAGAHAHQPIHVHVHLDGREIRTHRVLRGHHR